MAADLRWLRGEIEENPLTAKIDLDRLLVGLLHSLVREQQGFHNQSEEPQATVLAQAPDEGRS